MSATFPEILGFILLVTTAFLVVYLKNAVHAALALIANFMVVAAAYVGLEARFVAMAQIIVYGGAIVVLFLFVIMLLSAAKANVGEDILPGLKIPAIIGAVGLGGALIAALSTYKDSGLNPQLGGGQAEDIGAQLYDPNRWLFGLLVVGFLLLVATVVAVVLVEPERMIHTHHREGEESYKVVKK